MYFYTEGVDTFNLSTILMCTVEVIKKYDDFWKLFSVAKETQSDCVSFVIKAQFYRVLRKFVF